MFIPSVAAFILFIFAGLLRVATPPDLLRLLASAVWAVVSFGGFMWVLARRAQASE